LKPGISGNGTGVTCFGTGFGVEAGITNVMLAMARGAAGAAVIKGGRAVGRGVRPAGTGGAPS